MLSVPDWVGSIHRELNRLYGASGIKSILQFCMPFVQICGSFGAIFYFSEDL
jgi:hypothetical protein